VLVRIDFLFLGIVASQVGDMRGEIRLAPAILISVSGNAAATWQ
jgi:hypothetical protein